MKKPPPPRPTTEPIPGADPFATGFCAGLCCAGFIFILLGLFLGVM